MTASPTPSANPPEADERVNHQVRKQYRLYVVVVAVVSLLVGGVVGKYSVQKPNRNFQPDLTHLLTPLQQVTASTTTMHIVSKTLSIYVSGAVMNSCVVTVPQGSLVIDALELAGGAALDADLDAINLAAPLYDHDHILVPHLTSTSLPTVSSSAVNPIRVNINTAAVAELQGLPNIGPARAQQIISYRERHGPFQRVEDIMLVSGIGPAIYEELVPFIFVDTD